MNTLTAGQQQAVRDKVLAMKHIPSGLGTEDEACSVAAINLALSGELKDEIPDCMSPILGRWIIRVQDAMPDAMRNSLEWRVLLPLAAGSGRDADLEKRRKELIFTWMWKVVLPTVQPIADKHGFGESWKEMLTKKDRASAQKARSAAAAADAYAAAKERAWQTFDPIKVLSDLVALT